jgi:hypothetical protein
MGTPKLLRLAKVAGVIAILPGLAGAQMTGSVIVTPYVGLYTPATDLGAIRVSGGGTSVNLSLKHKTAAAFGANVSYWFNERFALEGGGVFAGSDIKGSGSINELGTVTSGSETETAHVWLASAKAMVQLLPSESDYNLRFGIGPAIISRGGRAYNSDASGKFTGLTDVGAAMSLCSRYAFTRNVAMRLRVEDYMYQSKIGWKATDPTESFSFDSKLQNDFVFSVGLQLFMNP